MGAHFPITLKLRSGGDAAGWGLVSLNPGVLRLGDGRAKDTAMIFDAQAAAVGRAELLVIDPSGQERQRAAVEVAQPDAVEVLPSTLFTATRPQPVARAQVLAGGAAAFGVRYLRAGVPLGGDAALTVDPPTTASVQVEHTRFGGAWDRITVSPRTQGRLVLTLRVAGQLAGEFPVDVVAEADIAGVVLESSEYPRTVIARVLDARSEAIYGVDLDWTFAGEALPGAGDVFLGDGPGPLRPLRARRGRHEASTSIDADRGKVAASRALGCSAAPGGAPGGAGLLPAALSLLALRRRRRHG